MKLLVCLCMVSLAYGQLGGVPLAGGWSNGDPTSDGVKQAVGAVLEKVNMMSNSMFRMVEAGQVTVQQQVVAGMNYKLSFMLGMTSCLKNDMTKTLADCPLSADNNMMQKVSATVWCQAWRSPPCQVQDNSLQMTTKGKKPVDDKVRLTDKPMKNTEDKVKFGSGRLFAAARTDPKVQKLLGGDGHDRYAGMFAKFVHDHNKLYGSEGETRMRYKIFCRNMDKAKKLQDTDKGTAKYGPTKFADMTEEEFSQYVGLRQDLDTNYEMKKAEIPKGPIPQAYDWRTFNAVTSVKNQGSCGSCWAFSTTGNIEGQWAIKKKKLVSLSEQELVDCDKVDQGCNGGLPSNAYKEIERLGGLETESEYKYVGEDEKCQFIKKDVRVYINDSVSISSNETEMAAWLAKNGPISIGINAFAMQFYMGGVSHPWKIFCNPKSLDHGVLIVGYGVKDSEPYWIVKNSWGPDWGEEGYYLVYRGAGVCGLNTMCTSSVVY